MSTVGYLEHGGHYENWQLLDVTRVPLQCSSLGKVSYSITYPSGLDSLLNMGVLYLSDLFPNLTDAIIISVADNVPVNNEVSAIMTLSISRFRESFSPRTFIYMCIGMHVYM